jgi:hypothetical protein
VHSPLGDPYERCNDLVEDLFRSSSDDSQYLGIFGTLIKLHKVESLRPTLYSLYVFIQRNVTFYTQEAESSKQETGFNKVPFKIRPAMLTNGCFQLNFQAVLGKLEFRIYFRSPYGLYTYHY